MVIDGLIATPVGLPGSARPAARRRPGLTATEFRDLGMFRVGYLTQVRIGGGARNIVLHGADGTAVAVVDTTDMAVDLADQLGLTLVAVH